jgi:hypothetical protein
VGVTFPPAARATHLYIFPAPVSMAFTTPV